MLNRSSHDDDEEVGIDLSPMIDCVFILLIFFIVTTVFVEETGVDVIKPIAESSERLEKNSILIAITEDGKVVYGGREIGVNGIRNVIRQLLLEEDMPVIIQADRAAEHGVFREVFKEVKVAGAEKISFSTEY